jgi:hypothetical protein
MTVAATPFFLRKAETLLGEDARSDLVFFLGANPEAGSIVPYAKGMKP